MKNRIRYSARGLALFLAICLVTTAMPATTFGATGSDIAGHWAEGIIRGWMDRGVVKGYEDGTFKPEAPVSQTEFTVLIKEIAGESVSLEEKAENSRITREEAALILTKIGGFPEKEGAAGVFKDGKNLSAGGKGAIGGLYAAAIMKGYPDGSFRGSDPMKRGELLAVLDKIVQAKEEPDQTTESAFQMTALGDSIAYGSKAEKGFGYTDLFYAGIMERKNLDTAELVNLGKPGRNSSELLRSIRTNKNVIDSLLQADIITISIGGNNLLRPVKGALAEEYQLDVKAAGFERDLTRLLLKKENRDKLKTVIASAVPGMDAGVKQFRKDWPKIIGLIRELAPEAEIYVMTVYNPLTEADPYFKTVNKRIQNLNKVIRDGSESYQLVDTYSSFGQYQGKDPLTNFNIMTGNFDIHPTKKGYEEIYQGHMEKVKEEE